MFETIKATNLINFPKKIRGMVYYRVLKKNNKIV